MDFNVGELSSPNVDTSGHQRLVIDHDIVESDVRKVALGMAVAHYVWNVDAQSYGVSELHVLDR